MQALIDRTILAVSTLPASLLLIIVLFCYSAPIAYSLENGYDTETDLNIALIPAEREILNEIPEHTRVLLQVTRNSWTVVFKNIYETLNFAHSIQSTLLNTYTPADNSKLANLQNNPKSSKPTYYYNILLWLAISIIILALLISALLVYNRKLKRSIIKNSSQYQKNQELLKIALDNANEGLWGWDIVEDSFYYTPKCFTILGYTPNEFEYSLDTWKSFVHPEDLELFNARLREAVDTLSTYPDSPLYIRIRSKENTYIYLSLTFTISETTPSGTAKRIIVTQKDITHEKKLDEILKNHLSELTRPLTTSQDITFSDIFDIEKIQYFQDSFAKMSEVASLIVSTDGVSITKPSNFSPFCTLVRSTKLGCANCIQSDSDIETTHGSYLEKICGSAGLMDGGTSIWVGEKRIAHWLVGQVRYSDEISEQQRSYAKEIGVNEDQYFEALKKLPVMSQEHFKDICQTMAIIAEQLSEMAYNNVLQARVINEKQQTEECLKKSEEKLVEAQKIARIGSWHLNTKTNKFSGSQQFWVTLHETFSAGKEVDLQDIFEIFHPNSADETKKQMLDLINSATERISKGADIAYRLKSRPDKQRYSHIIARVTGKTINGFNIIEGTLQDITYRVLNEIALKESQENLRVIFESIVNGIIATDANGIVTQVNPVALDILNMTSDELINADINDSVNLFEPETRLPIVNPVTKALESNEKIILHEHCIYISKNNIQKYVTVNASPIKNNDNELRGAVLVLHDITEQHETEQRLRQSQKLEAIGKLAGGIAHDFNNLLGGIIGFADLICSISNEDKSKEYAARIIDTSERAAELTSQMLTFARKGNPSSKPIDIHKCIKSALSILEHSIGKNIKLITHLDAQKHVVMGDASQIQNGILNLGINARDAIETYGELKIETVNISLTQEDCNNSEYDIKPGEYLSIYVSDTGCGMPPSIISKVFEPFFTTKGVGKGTGLGLSAFLGTIIAHNGSVTIDSKEGVGTKFTINLPLVSLSNANELTPSLPKDTTSKKTILLVDDQPIAISLGKAILIDEGYNLQIASNGEEALKIYLEKGDSIDLVIMDLIMPIMNGEEALEHLIQLDPDAKIILSSGMDRSTRIDELINSGKIVGFIHKPYSTNNLLSILKDIF